MTTATTSTEEPSYTPPSQPTGLEDAIRSLGTSIATLATSTDRRARVMLYLQGAATALLLVGTWGIITTAREVGTTAAHVDDLAATVANLAAEQRESREETREATSVARDVAEAAPRIEVTPPTKKGEKPTASLVIPARPARAATSATPLAGAATAEPPAPSVSIPLALPASVGVTVGAGP